MSIKADELEHRRLVAGIEPRLRQALVALYGPARGREADTWALSWASEHGYPPAGEASATTLRRLFEAAQARSHTLRNPPAFDDPREVGLSLGPQLAELLALLPMHDRVALLLAELGWTSEEIGGLLRTSDHRVERKLQRWRPRLEAAADGGGVDLDSSIALLFAEAAPPASPEEVGLPEVAPGLSWPAGKGSPAYGRRTRGSRRRRSKVLLAIVLVVAVLVGGLVLVLGGRQARAPKAYTTRGTEPPAGVLSGTILVVPPSREIGAPGPLGSGAVYEVDAGTSQVLAAPSMPPAVSAVSDTTVSGRWVAQLDFADAASMSDAAEAVAFDAGSTATGHLGLASAIYPGAAADTFWLRLDHETVDGKATRGCSIRLESPTGSTLQGPFPLPCNWQVLRATRQGLLVLSVYGITNVWTPESGIAVPVPDFPAATTDAAAGTLVSPQWSTFCATNCRLLFANPSTGSLRQVEVSPPPGSTFTTFSALSPDGRYLAITALPIDDAATFAGQPFFGTDADASRVIHGQLVIVRTANDEVALSRPVAYLDQPLVEWSPGGAFVFLTRSVTAVTAVPAWSASAPATVVTLPAGRTGPAAAERFLLIGR